MYKLFPLAYKHADPRLTGTVKEGELVKILADGSLEDMAGASTPAAVAVYHGLRFDDNKHVALSGIVASFNAESGFEPQIGDTVYAVDGSTVSTSDATGTRVMVGKCVGFASDGTYHVYVKGLLQ